MAFVQDGQTPRTMLTEEGLAKVRAAAMEYRTTPLPTGWDDHVRSLHEFMESETFEDDWQEALARTKDPPEVRVARGVALLDAQVPDWRSRIDVESLDLRTPSCILGQLYGSYVDGHIALGLGPLPPLHGRAVGFFEFSDKEAAAECEKCWRKAIASGSSVA
jgi:hypothetical protein